MVANKSISLSPYFFLIVSIIPLIEKFRLGKSKKPVRFLTGLTDLDRFFLSCFIRHFNKGNVNQNTDSNQDHLQ